MRTREEIRQQVRDLEESEAELEQAPEYLHDLFSLSLAVMRARRKELEWVLGIDLERSVGDWCDHES